MCSIKAKCMFASKQAKRGKIEHMRYQGYRIPKHKGIPCKAFHAETEGHYMHSFASIPCHALLIRYASVLKTLTLRYAKQTIQGIL